MIKNIIFDMGNVLIRYDINKYLEEVPKEYRKLLSEEIFKSLEWILLDKGEITHEEAKEKIKKRVPEECFVWVDKFLDNWHDEIPEYKEMEALVEEVKENGYKIYLLSNTSVHFHEFRKGIKALKHFDGEFISADCKLLKPDPAIYTAFLEHFSLKADECYFIDDSAVNIAYAMASGMKGFVYHGDIVKLRRDLIKNGIKVNSLDS